MATLTEAHKQALKQFRQRQTGTAEAAKQHAVLFRRHRQALQTALKEGPATVPLLAAKAGLPTEQVLWYVAGLRKYGLAREVGQDGNYVQYELIPAQAMDKAVA
jgi:Fic family protein